MPIGSHTKSKTKIRYAVVGLGHVSQAAILPAFANSAENSELTALVSGNPAKLRRLSEKYNVRHTFPYERYADCLHSGEIDAVYIALPNNMHKDFAVPAARAGIHVLCEKPMALEEADCELMIEAAKEAGVKLMPAYCTHFEPGNVQLVEAIQAGKIGEPRIFTSVFSQRAKPCSSHLKKDVGGGVLYDLGIHCINAARFLFGSEPCEAFASSTMVLDRRGKESSGTFAGLLKFAGDRVASFTVTFGAADRSAFEVIGTKGILKMDPAFEMAKDLKSEVTIGNWKIKEIFSRRDPYASELTYFSNCALQDLEPDPSGQTGLADVRIIRALQISAETRATVSIPQEGPSQACEPHQRRLKQPVICRPQLLRPALSGAD